MEVAEGQMVADGYLKEGKLTMFYGIPFDEDNPYNYREAKRVLGLAMDELRARREFAAELGIDLQRPGRPAITGRDASHVWDYLWFQKTADQKLITKVPHLGFSIHPDHTSPFVTLPNGMAHRYRRNLSGSVGTDSPDLSQKCMRGLSGACTGQMVRCPTWRSCSDAICTIVLLQSSTHDLSSTLEQCSAVERAEPGVSQSCDPNGSMQRSQPLRRRVPTCR